MTIRGVTTASDGEKVYHLVDEQGETWSLGENFLKRNGYQVVQNAPVDPAITAARETRFSVNIQREILRAKQQLQTIIEQEIRGGRGSATSPVWQRGLDLGKLRRSIQSTIDVIRKLGGDPTLVLDLVPQEIWRMMPDLMPQLQGPPT